MNDTHLYEVKFNTDICVNFYAKNERDAQERALRLLEMAFNYYDDIYYYDASMRSTLRCTGTRKLNEK